MNLVDKTFEGMIRQMQRDITDLNRRLSGPSAGLVPLYPDPSLLVNSTMQSDGTIILNGANDAFCLIPGIFTTNVRAYQMVFSIYGAGPANQAIFRFMNGPVPDDTSVYNNTRQAINTGSSVVSGYSQNTYGLLSYAATVGGIPGTADILEPSDATRPTSVTFATTAADISNSGAVVYGTAKAFDGIAIQRGPTGGAKTTLGWVKFYARR